MIIRFGYVSTALNLYEASPAKTMTFARWSKLEKAKRQAKLHALTRENLERTIRILHYNIAHQIKLYRFSSSLAPLATHEEAGWDYLSPFTDLYGEIGRLVREYGIRVSFHPNQFTLFTSDKPHITSNAVKDMQYHYNMLTAMGLEDEAYINIHVGGAYGNKELALERFHENIKQLPDPIKAQMTLENDDKTYTTTETLDVCERHRIPMMFDIHHYMANHTGEEPLEKVLPRFMATWQNRKHVPKIHTSSPKSEKAFRSHADYVDVEFLMPLIKHLKDIGQSVDFMIEAKQKDKAALRLAEDISRIRGVKRIGEATVEL
ncbi:UV DNA damage endonuclease [Terribacillus halophilus]|uniref:UV DNA damage endonuclease n=1 Tax=Terribacillus halophilus TaxID=361279 RepID=A0A1G6HSL9_9BACI|nr:UV DNA damage repair endonuclease UvsE [Terribacillus halophilus]SDB97222.1 UV DNA damage endonuclease [Terribacillus halophilus]